MPSSPRSERSLTGLFKHSAIYSAAPFIRQLVAVVMHVFYTGWLGTVGVGVKEIVDLFAIGMQQVLGQNILGSMVRFYFDRQKPEDRARVVTSSTLVVTLAAWIVCGLVFSISRDLAPLVFKAEEEMPKEELVGILRLVLVLIPFQLSTVAGFYYLMILKRSNLFTTIQTGKLLVEVALNFLLIGFLGLGVRGFLLSMLAGEILTSAALTGWMLVTLKPRIDWRILKPILIYAAPLVPVGLCQLSLHQLDRWLIGHYWEGRGGAHLIGIYGHGYKISYLVTAMMLGPFIQIFQPWIFEVKDAIERGRLLARVSSYAVLVVGAASLCVILGGRQAAILLASSEKPEFYDAFQVIPYISAGYVFWALYHVSQMPLFIAKRTGRLFGINLAAVVVNVGLNAWMIPRYGYVGAGITTCITFAVLAAMGMMASRSEAPVQFELGRIAGVLLVVIGGGAIALWIDHAENFSELGVVAAILAKAGALVLAFLVLWFAVLRSHERSGFFAWLRSRRGGKP